MKLIPVSKGKVFAKVSDEDYEYLSQFNWTIKTSKVTNNLYAKRFAIVNGKHTTKSMHSEICKVPKGQEVDHIDGDGLNNQRSNLRPASLIQNRQNRKKQKNSQSKYIGVNKQGRKFYAKIWSNGKTVGLGTFETAESAALAYDKEALRLRGSFAKLNFSTVLEPGKEE